MTAVDGGPPATGVAAALARRVGARLVVVDEPAQRLTWLAERGAADFVVVVPPGVERLPSPVGSVLALAEGSDPAVAAGRVATDLARRLGTHVTFRRLPGGANGDGAAYGARVAAAAREDLAQLVVLEASPGEAGPGAPLGALAAGAARYAEQPIVLVPPMTSSSLTTPTQQGEPDAHAHPKRRRRRAGAGGSPRPGPRSRVRSRG